MLGLAAMVVIGILIGAALDGDQRRGELAQQSELLARSRPHARFLQLGKTAQLHCNVFADSLL